MSSSTPPRLADFGIDPTYVNGKSLLVTGGTGSFGKHLVNYLLERTSPKRLIILSRDELKQFEMAEDLSRHPKCDCLRFFIGDVRDASRLEMAFRDVNLVVHAAALKQVTTAEYNPFEAIHTNVLGAENVVRAALRCGVERVVALSTDKAASPANLYGASKLASDKIFVAANSLSGENGTRFGVVRYGNVVGSRGSVVPFFRRLIEQGVEALPITDPRMTRFWITLGQGVDFVVSSLATMSGGEIFVPKIPSMRIVDLAKAMAPQLPQTVVGIRPGEKIHEIMITADDARNTYDLGNRYVIAPAFEPMAQLCREVYRAAPLADGFTYASDNNPQWLTSEQLREMIS